MELINKRWAKHGYQYKIVENKKILQIVRKFSAGFFFISLAIVTGKLSLEIAQVVQKPNRRKSNNAQCYKRPFGK